MFRRKVEVSLNSNYRALIKSGLSSSCISQYGTVELGYYVPLRE